MIMLHGWFSVSVRRHPGDPALVVRDRPFIYAELVGKSNVGVSWGSRMVMQRGRL